MKVLRILKSSNKESCSLFNSLQINILFGIFRAWESIFWIISFSNEFELIQISNSISTGSTVNLARSARIASAWCSPIAAQRCLRQAASRPSAASYAIRTGHPPPSFPPFLATGKSPTHRHCCPLHKLTGDSPSHRASTPTKPWQSCAQASRSSS
jgi:hypothetical protein